MSRVTVPPGGRLRLFGTPIDSVTMDQAVARCELAIDSSRPLRQMSVNAAKLVALSEDPAMQATVASCGLVTADGQGAVWATRLLGGRLPERVAGIDLMQRLLTAANEKGYRVYVLGAKREVLDEALERLRERYPRLIVAGSRDGYFDAGETAEVCEEIRAARPDILFIAMSSPRKEHFLGEWVASTEVPFAMGVGGAVDVIAGVTRRAPRMFQRLGLEWAYRFAQEPRRLARRYVNTNLRFIGMVLRGVLSRAGLEAEPEPAAETKGLAEAIGVASNGSAALGSVAATQHASAGDAPAPPAA